jgi:hypothetical protein
MSSSTQNLQTQPDASATLAQGPALAPVEFAVVCNATSTSTSSSVTASVLSESPQSFRKQGGTVKRNIQGKNEVWEFFQIYNEKNFKNSCFLHSM